MGARGPLKIPSHLRPVKDGEVAGTVAEKIEPVAPTPPPGFPDDPDLRQLWDDLVPKLDEAGLLAKVDGPTIELALRHFLAARQASDALAGGQVVIADPAHGGVKKNPAGAEFRSQSDLFLKYAAQLGMSFVARARTPVAKEPDGDGEANPFQANVG